MKLLLLALVDVICGEGKYLSIDIHDLSLWSLFLDFFFSAWDWLLGRNA